MKEVSNIKMFTPSDDSSEQPMAGAVHAGFPSPADDFPDTSLNITRELVRNPAATFYARVSGDSMTGDGIDDGDLLVVDKSVEPYDGCIAICFIDGEFTLKHVEMHPDYALLVPANPQYKAIRVTADNNFMVWGVVRYVIKKL